MKSGIATVVLASAATLANAGTTFVPQKLNLTPEQIGTLCEQTNQRSGILLHGVDLCKTPGNNKSTATPPVVAASKSVTVEVKEDTGNPEICPDGTPRDKLGDCTLVNDEQVANETPNSESSDNKWYYIAGLGVLVTVARIFGVPIYRKLKGKKPTTGMLIGANLNQESGKKPSFFDRIKSWIPKTQKQRDAEARLNKILSVRQSLEKLFDGVVFNWEEKPGISSSNIAFHGKHINIIIDNSGNINVCDESIHDDLRYVDPTGHWAGKNQHVSFDMLERELKSLFPVPPPQDDTIDDTEIQVSEEGVVSPVDPTPDELSEVSSTSQIEISIVNNTLIVSKAGAGVVLIFDVRGELQHRIEGLESNDKYTLNVGDTVVLAADEVLNTMSASWIIDVIRSQSSEVDARKTILGECALLNENVDNNSGLTIYHHTKEDITIKTTPETPASDVPAEPAPTVNREEEVIATKEDPKEINMNAYQVDDDASFGALMAAFNNLRISDVASRPSESVPVPKKTEEEAGEDRTNAIPKTELSSDEHHVVQLQSESTPVGVDQTDEVQGNAPVVENKLTPTEVTSGVPVALEGEIPTDEAQGIAPVVDSPKVPTEETLVIPVSETVADVPSDSAQNNEISTQGVVSATLKIDLGNPVVDTPNMVSGILEGERVDPKVIKEIGKVKSAKEEAEQARAAANKYPNNAGLQEEARRAEEGFQQAENALKIARQNTDPKVIKEIGKVKSAKEEAEQARTAANKYPNNAGLQEEARRAEEGYLQAEEALKIARQNVDSKVIKETEKVKSVKNVELLNSIKNEAEQARAAANKDPSNPKLEEEARRAEEGLQEVENS